MNTKDDIKDLKRLMGRNHEIRTIVRHVSQSGMTRRISCYIVSKGEIHCIDYLVSRIIGWKQHKDGGVVVSGCGMDMGFHLIYTLSRVMYPKGFAVQGVGRNGDSSGHDKDGGYKLTQRWM